MNCYNGGRYLRAALDSVMAQTYRNWELIFWDNQSTDDSAAICKSYADSRIRYFYANEHTELGAARIQAFKHIRGEFVAVLDTDDVAYPERLARQVSFLEQHLDVALAGSWAKYIDENGRVFGEFKPPANQEELQDSLGWTNPLAHSSVIYRYQSALQVGGYSKDIVWAQDFDLSLALAQHFNIAIIDVFLCQVRVLKASMTRSKQYQILAAREALSLFQRAAASLKLSTKARRLNRRAIAITEIRLGLANLRNNSVVAGLNMVLHGVMTSPSALWGNGPARRFFGAKF